MNFTMSKGNYNINFNTLVSQNLMSKIELNLKNSFLRTDQILFFLQKIRNI